jgi:Nif-specific regulatory protein
MDRDQVSPKNDLENLIAISNLINRICGLRETNHIMETIVAELVEKTNADQGIVSLIISPQKDNLSTVIRIEDNKTDAIPYQLGTLLTGWVLKNNRLLKIDDLDNDERFRSLNSGNGVYKSIICCPLVARGEITGFITLVRGVSKGCFNDNQCHLVGILAPQAAQILSNAKLLEELTRAKELLEISQRKLKAENLQLKSEIKSEFVFENIIGKSPQIKKALSLVSKYCTNDAPVLITGGTGTGKELIARAIHFNSERKDAPFVVKNCSIKTESLLESELFGHKRGAFTGAIKDKIGLFKEADRGTIFLDEIGDAPLTTQAAILRVIQNGEIRPIGGTKTEIVNVRVLSATNKSLKDEISKGNFREDLFYRLNTFCIELPHLKERPHDIPLLVKYFLDKQRIKTGRQELTISSEAMDMLIKYAWPGNIRQLENEIERASVVCGPNNCLMPKDFSNDVIVGSRTKIDFASFGGSLSEAVSKLETEMIKIALTEHKGNILQTSKTLGLTRKGLMNKIDRHKISMEISARASTED